MSRTKIVSLKFNGSTFLIVVCVGLSTLFLFIILKQSILLRMCRIDPGRQLQNANKLHVKGGSPEEKRKHRIFFLKASLREGYNKNKKDQAGKKSKKTWQVSALHPRQQQPTTCKEDHKGKQFNSILFV